MRTLACCLAVATLAVACSIPVAAQRPDSSHPMAAPAPGAIEVKESLIAEVAAGSNARGVSAVPGHVAWAEVGGKSLVRLDGKQVGGLYDEVRYVTISINGAHVVFIGKRDGAWVLIVDGVERTRHYTTLSAPAVDSGATKVLVTMCNDNKCRLVADSTEIGPVFEEILGPTLTPDQHHVFYAGHRHGKWVMVMDSLPRGPEMDGLCDCLISPDNVRLFAAGRLKNGWTWVVDTVVGPTFNQIGVVGFSQDAKHFAYGASNAPASGSFGIGYHKTPAFLVVDGRSEARGEASGFGNSLLTAIGAHPRLVTGLTALHVDFNGVSDPTFTAEGKLVYAAQRSPGDVALFVDSAVVGQYQNIASEILTFGEGTHTYFIARSGTTLTEMIDQRPGASISNEPRNVIRATHLELSRDASHRAFEIVRGGETYMRGETQRALRRIVMDGKAGPEYDALGIPYLWFSDDGRHLAYVVDGAKGDQSRMVVDGNEGRLYDWIYAPSVKAAPDGTVTFIAGDQKRILQITETAASPQ